MNIGRILLAVISAVSILFLGLPIVVLVVRTIDAQAWQSLTAGVVSSAVYLSFITTTITAILTIIFGTPLAYVLARWHFRGRRFLNVLIELPIVLPPAVAGLALLLTLGRRGALGPWLNQFEITIPFTLAAVVIAQMFVAAPFYIRSAQVGLRGVPRDLEDAARVDGAAGLTLFYFITLPLAGRALMAGLILCWARALGEFGATILFAGSLQGRTQTMPLLIYNILERDLDAAIATGVLLVALALIALLLSQWVTNHPTTENQ